MVMAVLVLAFRTDRVSNGNRVLCREPSGRTLQVGGGEDVSRLFQELRCKMERHEKRRGCGREQVHHIGRQEAAQNTPAQHLPSPPAAILSPLIALFTTAHNHL